MSKRGKKLPQELGTFLRKYARKAQKNVEPNDRHYDRKIERLIQRMQPAELDRLMHEEPENDLESDS